MLVKDRLPGGAKVLLGMLPLGLGAEPCRGVVSRRQSDVIDGKPQDFLSTQCCPQPKFSFVEDPVRSAEDVSVVEVDLPDATQTRYNTGTSARNMEASSLNPRGSSRYEC